MEDEFVEEVEEQVADVVEEEDGFMQGYTKDEEVEECAECGTAVTKEKKVMKSITEEEYAFCSKDCAKDFEESAK
ncbi:hypothetical protein HYX14_00985 [Candidatus Woesearchaeota archaeon]|nr:hypothetical protein [Candidatus Woesearchaeota archaeon]